MIEKETVRRRRYRRIVWLNENVVYFSKESLF